MTVDRSSIMMRSGLAVAMLAGACGTVTGELPDATTGTSDGPVSATPVTYKGSTAQTAATPFGGSGYCSYTIVLKQLDVQLGIVPTGKQVTSGQVQYLGVEAVVPTTPPCPYGPAGPVIENYTFASSTPTATGVTLMFQGAPANSPIVTLSVDLSAAGSGYQARLNLHRTDVPVPLNWTVTTTLTLAPP
jgi:hypothetical protein